MDLAVTPEASLPPAGLMRRLGALLYDSLLLLALLLFATAAVLPFTHGEALAAGNRWFSAYLLLVSWLFFGWFWTHGGQTLGMRAWRIRVQALDGAPITARQALIRLLVAVPSWLLLGLGFLWLLADRDRRTWYDQASRTRLVVLPKA